VTDLLAALLNAGGPVMALLVAVSFLLWFRLTWWSLELRRFLRRLEGLADLAAETAAKQGKAACRALLFRRLRGDAAFEPVLQAAFGENDPYAVEAACSTLAEKLRSPEGPLSSLVTAAPLLGLLGTVVGMVQTFSALTLGGAADPRALGGGISCALVTTQAGLAVALAGLYGVGWVGRRSKQVATELELIQSVLVRLCKARSTPED